MLTSEARLHPLTLCFDDESLEAAFRSDVFRSAFLLHLSHFIMLIVVLAVGLMDPPFRLISCSLMPLGMIELVLRIYLHSLPDQRYAQRKGAAAMLCLTTAAWSVYVFATRQRAGEEPASLLIAAFISLMLLIYPVQLALFMLSPQQRGTAFVAALCASLISPPWSVLTKTEELCLHAFALLAGITFSYAIEKMMRTALIQRVEAALQHEALIRERLNDLHEESERRRVEADQLRVEADAAEQQRASAEATAEGLAEELERMEEQWATQQSATREQLRASEFERLRAWPARLKLQQEQQQRQQQKLHADIARLEAQLEQARSSPTRAAISCSMTAAERMLERPRYGALKDNRAEAKLIRPGSRAPPPLRPAPSGQGGGGELSVSSELSRALCRARSSAAAASFDASD